jgi:REP-associated tyrosine transposase
MPYDPEKHHRRSIRLHGYDYSAPGKYFVTICVQQRECLYGEVINGEMKLNDAGRMVEIWWRKLANKFPPVDLDEHVTMPNHFHGIIVIVNRREREKDLFHAGKSKEQIAQAMASVPEKSAPLPEIIQWFKTMTTNEYIRGGKESGWPRFDRKLWQRNYYEHTIFSLKTLRNIRQYIRANPPMWPYDRDNQERIAPDREKISPFLEENIGVTDEDLDFILRFDNECHGEEEFEL